MSKVRDIWVRAALLLSLALPLYFAVAALGAKFHLMDWRIAFVDMTFIWGPRLLIAALIGGVIAVVLALLIKPRGGIRSALIALLIPALGLGYAFTIKQQADGVPPIHDISTDLVDPPGFSEAVIAARNAVPDHNDLDLLNKRTGEDRAFTDLQREAYPDIAPIETSLAPGAAFDLALAAAREQGWRIGETDRDGGRIEASEESFWFGFTDDIAIRVRPEGEGSRIDMRSVSRVGRSDLGVNAKRMRPYLETLRARAEAAG